jgi:hypothetical protein
MNLQIDITINNTGTALWIEDQSLWYDTIGHTNQDYAYYLSEVSITFIDYIDSEGTTTVLGDNIKFADNVITGRFFEILPADITSQSWTEFPEGIYNIQFGVTTENGVDTPTNNSTYYYQQAMFWKINNYLTDLQLQVARDYNGMVDPSNSEYLRRYLNDDFLFRYTIMFGAKFEAFQAALNVSGSISQVTAENVSEALNSLLFLQKLMAQYPSGSYNRRFIK